jgi:hypothetical protein
VSKREGEKKMDFLKEDMMIVALCKNQSEQPCGWVPPPPVKCEEAPKPAPKKMMYCPPETVYGNKYEATKNMSTTDIAKAFREDVKAAIKAGKLPKGLKLSVRTKYFSGGSSIDVNVTALPANFPMDNPNYDPEWYAPETMNDPWSPELRAAMTLLKSILDAYNYDGSDIMTDYFHVRFYGHVNLRLKKDE